MKSPKNESSKRIQLDLELIKTLAGFGLTLAEIAAACGCSDDTLHRRARAQIDRGWADMRASLKRKQYEVAMAGNVTMLIWLGKNYLDQTDRQVVDQTGPTTIKVEYEDTCTARRGARDDR